MPRKKQVPQTQELSVLPLPDQLKDIEWVQGFLQVSRSRVFQLMEREGLPYIKWDRTLRFHPHAIACWLAEQQQKSA
jgi:hypothetical protein